MFSVNFSFLTNLSRSPYSQNCMRMQRWVKSCRQEQAQMMKGCLTLVSSYFQASMYRRKLCQISVFLSIFLRAYRLLDCFLRTRKTSANDPSPSLRRMSKLSTLYFPSRYVMKMDSLTRPTFCEAIFWLLRMLLFFKQPPILFLPFLLRERPSSLLQRLQKDSSLMMESMSLLHFFSAGGAYLRERNFQTMSAREAEGNTSLFLTSSLDSQLLAVMLLSVELVYRDTIEPLLVLDSQSNSSSKMSGFLQVLKVVMFMQFRMLRSTAVADLRMILTMSSQPQSTAKWMAVFLSASSRFGYAPHSTSSRTSSALFPKLASCSAVRIMPAVARSTSIPNWRRVWAVGWSFCPTAKWRRVQPSMQRSVESSMGYSVSTFLSYWWLRWMTSCSSLSCIFWMEVRQSFQMLPSLCLPKISDCWSLMSSLLFSASPVSIFLTSISSSSSEEPCLCPLVALVDILIVLLQTKQIYNCTPATPNRGMSWRPLGITFKLLSTRRAGCGWSQSRYLSVIVDINHFCIFTSLLTRSNAFLSILLRQKARQYSNILFLAVQLHCCMHFSSCGAVLQSNLQMVSSSQNYWQALWLPRRSLIVSLSTASKHQQQAAGSER